MVKLGKYDICTEAIRELAKILMNSTPKYFNLETNFVPDFSFILIEKNILITL